MTKSPSAENNPEELRLIEQFPSAIAYLDENLNYTACSKSWKSFYQLSQANIVGKSYLDLSPDWSGIWQKHYQLALNGHASFSKKEKIVLNEENIYWLKWEITPLYVDHVVTGLVHQIENITEKVSKEKKRRRNLKLLKKASKVAQIGGWEFDLITQELFWTSITKEIHEVSPAYIPNLEEAFNFYHGQQTKKKIQDVFNRLIQDGTPFDVELRIKTQTGKIKWVRSIGNAVYQNGICVKQYGTFEDITLRKTYEEQIQFNLQRYKKIYNDSGVAMITVHAESFDILDVNRSASKLLGYIPSKLKKFNLSHIIDQEGFDVHQQEISTLKSNSTSTCFEITSKYTTKGKKHIDVNVIGSYLNNKSRRMEVVILQVIDVTELELKKEELQNFVDYTTKQNQRLLNFAHIVSHNLRSHSSNFELLVDLYSKESNKKEKEKIFNYLQESSAKLSTTIDNLNEIVSIHSEKLDLVEVYFDDQVSQVLSSIQGEIKKHHTDVIHEYPKDLMIKAVPAYIESILLNLITNSLRYKSADRTPKIIIKAYNKEGKTHIEISDNGMGIDLVRFAPNLFGMYKTFHEHPEARGIGLYMTKNQVEAMGGTIDVSSKIDQGTVFSITL